jgi:hypothetical protein
LSFDDVVVVMGKQGWHQAFVNILRGGQGAYKMKQAKMLLEQLSLRT